ncbi:MAG TPA: hypothetical protein VNR38_06320 [Ureibacillus sp.]|nr:hypothetical protein [Ureibacillus sp.]
MKNFRTLDQAKKDLKVIQDYVDLIENYQPKDFRQHVIYTYMQQGNLEKTANEMNKKGFKIADRYIEPEDIKTIIISNPPIDDLLHKKLKSLYLKKTRANRRTSKPLPSGSSYYRSIYTKHR